MRTKTARGDVRKASRASRRKLVAKLEIARLLMAEGVDASYELILDTAMAILNSDFASIQTFHPDRGPNGELKLLSHRGFDAKACTRWEWVRPSMRTACSE